MQYNWHGHSQVLARYAARSRHIFVLRQCSTKFKGSSHRPGCKTPPFRDEALGCSLVSSIKRLDIVPDFEFVRREAVHTIFSTVSFGLGCNVAFDKGGTHASLISIDPYPHHVLASLQLASDVLLVYLERGEISHDAFESSCRIESDALDALPQSLSSVQKAKKSLHHKLMRSMHPPGTDSSLPIGTVSATIVSPRERRIRHVVNDAYHIGLVGGGAMSKGSDCDIVGTNEAFSLSTLHPADIDEAGLDALADKLFSSPAIALSTALP